MMNLLRLHLGQSQQSPNPSYRQSLFIVPLTGRKSVAGGWGEGSDYWKSPAMVFPTLDKVLSLVQWTILSFPINKSFPKLLWK